MRLGRLWRTGHLAVLGGYVAGSEGPDDPDGPSQPEPGLRADLFAGPIEAPRQIPIDAIDRFAAHQALPAGAEAQYLRHMKLRRSMPLGEYYVGSIMDVTGAVAEASEGNNPLQFPVPILLTATVPDSPASN